MPTLPYLVSGIVTDSDSNAEANVNIRIGKVLVTTDSDGKYIIDLAEYGYVANSTITYSAEDKYRNETANGTIVLTGDSQTLDITLSERDDVQVVPGNRDTQVFNIGAKAISKLNPFPVRETNPTAFQNYFLEISRGNVPGASLIHKFGNAPDFDTGDNMVSVWDGVDDGDLDVTVYTYSTTAAIDSISSDNDTDTQNIEIQGLDSNFNLVTQIITLTGQTRKAMTTDLIRVFRMKNISSTNNAGHIYCYENVATTGGKPNTASLVRAVIQPLANQTLMAIYTIPAGCTGYLTSFYAGTAGANKSSNYKVELRARPAGQVFQIKHLSNLADSGTSHWNHLYQAPEVFAAKTDIEMRCQVLAAGVTAATVSAGFDIILLNN